MCCRGNHPIPVFLAGLVLIMSFAGGCASLRWTPRPCSLEGANRDLLLNAPVVPVIFFNFETSWELVRVRSDGGTIHFTKTASAGCSGSATVISKDRLLLSAHEVDADKGMVLVDGGFTEYKVVKRVDSSEEAGGWVLVELAKPMQRSFSSIGIDFKANLSVGDTVFVVYCEPFDTAEAAKQYVEAVTQYEDGKTKERARDPRKNVLVEGRVAPTPFWKTSMCLDEFLLIDTRCPGGSSGSPVFWWRDDNTPVLVGIIGGIEECRLHDWLTGKPTGKLIAAVQLICQPREYEPMETTEVEK